MEYISSFVKPTQHDTQCLVVGVFAGGKLTAEAQVLDHACSGALSEAVDSGDMNGSAGKTLLLRKLDGISAQRVLLVGLGAHAEFSRRRLKAASTSVASTLLKLGATDATLLLAEQSIAGVTSQQLAADIVHSINQNAYQYDTTKSTPAASRALEKINVAVCDKSLAASTSAAVCEAVAVANGVSVARELGNLPGNVCTPTYLAEQGLQLAEEYAAITTTIVEEQQMAEMGMGALLAVSQGSVQPAKIVCMEYNGGTPGDKPHVLVGKGLTFDAGGISLKPGAGMDSMKMDKCGGTAVFGTMRAIAEMGLALNVIGVVPASENLPDAKAVKPGDVVTAMNGTTIEILNTDAEGRLILCDALCYVKAHYQPASIIDLATLTGAVVVALGNHRSAVFSPDQTLANRILAAGISSDDLLWQMPLGDEYADQLKSTWADMANIGGAPAGSITAAEFLHHFMKGMPWAHLDIAGTAMSMGGVNRKGASGRPVRALVQYLSDQVA